MILAYSYVGLGMVLHATCLNKQLLLVTLLHLFFQATYQASLRFCVRAKLTHTSDIVNSCAV